MHSRILRRLTPRRRRDQKSSPISLEAKTASKDETGMSKTYSQIFASAFSANMLQ